MDEYSANIVVTNNTVANCSYGFFLHRANTNTIKNNTSFNNLYGIWFNNSVGSSTIYDNTINGNIFLAKTGTQFALGFRSDVNDIPKFGTADNNYYAKPIDDNLTFYTYQPSEGVDKRTLSGWQAFTGQDANSHKSPKSITDTADIDFYYNATKVNKAIQLNQPMIDVKGLKYTNSISLLPFTSMVLMVDPNPVQPVIPVYTGSAIENAAPSMIEMTYSLTLANILPAASAFSVQVNSVPRSINSVSITGSKVSLILFSPITSDNVVTVTYTAPSSNPLQTPAGAKAASITAQSVTNKVIPQLAIPVYVNSAVENAAASVIEMIYNLALANIVPATSAFSVQVNSATRSVNSVLVFRNKSVTDTFQPRCKWQCGHCRIYSSIIKSASDSCRREGCLNNCSIGVKLRQCCEYATSRNKCASGCPGKL